MIIKDESTRSRRDVAVSVVLVLALALLWGWHHDRAVTTSASVPASDAVGPFSPDAGPTPQPALDRLELSFGPQQVTELVSARTKALADGILLHGDLVPVSLRWHGRTLPAMARLKGDWLDHVNGDKWSLRIELAGSGRVLGMRTFSIEDPRTRGYLNEWVAMAAARREGVLAPRSCFVDVVVNGRSSGVYYLEEHASKELLEAAGRRDGPIVRFREDTMWTTWLQYGYRIENAPPAPALMEAAAMPSIAEVAAFDEGHLRGTEAMEQRLARARSLMLELQKMSLGPGVDRRLQALESLRAAQGRTIDELFVPDSLGRFLALYALFDARHGLVWHQLRFYHDPVRDRLEPLCFDTGAHIGTNEPYELAQLAPLEPQLEAHRSDACYEATFAEAARITQPAWIDDLLADLTPDLERYAAAIAAEAAEAKGVTTPADAGAMAVRLIRNGLREQADALRRIVLPDDPANFDGCVTEDGDRAEVEVDAWTTGWAPVYVHGFRFGNGAVLRASDALPPGHEDLVRPNGCVALPRLGRRLHFRFALDSRLAGLRELQSFKRWLRSGAKRGGTLAVAVDVRFGAVGAPAVSEEPLRLRRQDRHDPSCGRPPAPSLTTLLERHAFLGYDVETDRLFVRPGTWDITGDLVLPATRPLHVGAGTTLRFQPGAVLLSEAAVLVEGSASAPAVLEPRDAAAPWGGVVVLDAEPSRWSYAVVRGAGAVARGGWQTSSGLCFYHAPVTLTHVRIESAHGDDAINVYGTDVEMEDCELAGAPSDLLDGDFVHGHVKRCEFRDAGGDAVDVSGSELEVAECHFQHIADKAFSVGEASRVVIRDCHVDDAGIGVASKDASTAEVDGLDIEHATHFLLAVYVKKPEYGPATMRVQHLGTGTADDRPWLVQEGCTLDVDGTRQPGVAVDVGELYRQKILGR